MFPSCRKKISQTYYQEYIIENLSRNVERSIFGPIHSNHFIDNLDP